MPAQQSAGAGIAVHSIVTFAFGFFHTVGHMGHVGYYAGDLSDLCDTQLKEVNGGVGLESSSILFHA
jgi:hypothetical protein